MSIQEMRSRLHHLLDEVSDEVILQEVSRILSAEPRGDILDDLTNEQLAVLEKAREEARNGQGMSLEAFKPKMETRWPQLTSS